MPQLAKKIGTGPMAPFHVVAPLPNSSTFPVSIRTSEVASVGVPLRLRLTGISVSVFTLNGAEMDVAGPCVPVIVAGPAGSAGTVAMIWPLLQLLVTEDNIVEPKVKLTVPASVPN